VCAALGWPLLDKDDAKDVLQQALPHVTTAQHIDANALSYDLMFSFAGTQLSLGLSAALDCPFARVALYERAAALAAQVGGDAAMVANGST
jgi:predicted kinase